MQQRMFAIGQDFWIETDTGDRVIKFDGKAIRLRDKLIIDDSAAGWLGMDAFRYFLWRETGSGTEQRQDAADSHYELSGYRPG